MKNTLLTLTMTAVAVLSGMVVLLHTPLARPEEPLEVLRTVPLL